jgi:hypothetical protein
MHLIREFEKIFFLGPPTDGKGFRDFYHNQTNYILQQMKRKFWKIANLQNVEGLSVLKPQS